MAKERMVSFRNQRVTATIVFFLLVFAATTAVLWGHIDGIITDSTYQWLAKGGLLAVPFVGIVVTIWELFVDDTSLRRRHQSHPTVKRLVNWCFCASWGLLIVDVVHMGALLKFEQSSRQQEKTIALVGDQQAKIAREVAQGAIESSGKVTKDLNAAGQTRSAARVSAQGKDIAAAANNVAQERLAEEAAKAKPKTFLPESYTDGGMYVALPALAVVILMVTMAFARAAAPHVDKNDDGRPDAEEVQEEFPTEIRLPGK